MAKRNKNKKRGENKVRNESYTCHIWFIETGCGKSVFNRLQAVYEGNKLYKLLSVYINGHI